MTLHLMARAAFYLDITPDIFDPHDFDAINGRVVIRRESLPDSTIGFRLNAYGHTAFTGPDYPRGEESQFVAAFVAALIRPSEETNAK
jgi:hypothetical protein